jgi:hypothetical protein
VPELLARELPGATTRTGPGLHSTTIEELIHAIQKLAGRIVSPLVPLDDIDHQRLVGATVLRAIDAQRLEECLGMNIDEHVPQIEQDECGLSAGHRLLRWLWLERLHDG